MYNSKLWWPNHQSFPLNPHLFWINLFDRDLKWKFSVLSYDVGDQMLFHWEGEVSCQEKFYETWGFLCYYVSTGRNRKWKFPKKLIIDIPEIITRHQRLRRCSKMASPRTRRALKELKPKDGNNVRQYSKRPNI